MQVEYVFQKSWSWYSNIMSWKGIDHEESQKNITENLTVKGGTFRKFWREGTAFATVYHYLSLPFILFPSFKS